MTRLPNKAPIAFLGSVGVGAAVCSIQFAFLLMAGWAESTTSVAAILTSTLLLFLISWPFAAFFFFGGLLLIGMPAWAGLVALGWLSRGAAVAAGALLAALAGGLLGSAGSGLSGGLPSAGFLLLPGAAAGWVLHRIAYGAGEDRP